MAAPDNPDRVLLFNIVTDNIITRPELGDQLTGINQPNDIINEAITDIVNGNRPPLVREGQGGRHLNMIFDTIERFIRERPEQPQVPQGPPPPREEEVDKGESIDPPPPFGGKLRKTSKKRPTRRGRSSKARKARTTRRK